MRGLKRSFGVAALCIAVVAPADMTAGAAGYDFSNPSSTKCVSKGPLDYSTTTRTFGVWSVRLRRSTGCNTVWGVVTRLDTKRCQNAGRNCAKIRITRVRGTGTKAATAWRKMQGGTKSGLSFQLDGLTNSVFTARAATFGGKLIGESGTLSLNQNGTWTAR